MASVSIESIAEQLTSAGIPFKCSSDPDWATYSAPYNIRLPVTPAVIVLPHDVSHIQKALACAREHGLKVQARSGGHSYASHSIGGVDGAMVIDMRGFQSIHADDNIIRVETGVRLGNLAKALYDEFDQKQALPHGTCAGVGVGGHFTHGGFGMFSRAWGLAMDRIVGMTVITADGECVFCDNRKNGDLFYAMRGAGDSFGIVKSFDLETVPAPASVLHWAVNISDVTKSVKSVVAAFKHIQNFVHNVSVIDRQLGVQLSMTSNHFSIDGTYLGSRDTLENKILPAITGKIAQEKKINIAEHDWLASVKSLNQDEEITTDPSSVYKQQANFFAKGVVVPEPGFTSKAMHSFFTYLLDEGARAPVSYFILFDLYGGRDSQINTKAVDFSAFAHRNACWVIQLYGYVDNDAVFPPEGIEFINGFSNSITSNLNKCGAYSNYTDPSLSREDAHKLYFRETSNILQRVKKVWDPDNLIENPQSILPD